MHILSFLDLYHLIIYILCIYENYTHIHYIILYYVIIYYIILHYITLYYISLYYIISYYIILYYYIYIYILNYILYTHTYSPSFFRAKNPLLKQLHVPRSTSFWRSMAFHQIIPQEMGYEGPQTVMPQRFFLDRLAMDPCIYIAEYSWHRTLHCITFHRTMSNWPFYRWFTYPKIQTWWFSRAMF